MYWMSPKGITSGRYRSSTCPRKPDRLFLDVAYFLNACSPPGFSAKAWHYQFGQEGNRAFRNGLRTMKNRLFICVASVLLGAALTEIWRALPEVNVSAEEPRLRSGG